MQERADRSIQEPGESTFYLNLPELGIIPVGRCRDSRPSARYVGIRSSPANLKTPPKASDSAVLARFRPRRARHLAA